MAEVLRVVIAEVRRLRVSGVGGVGRVILATWIWPLMPGSWREAVCWTRRGRGWGEERKERRTRTTSSVLRSQVEEVGERERVW